MPTLGLFVAEGPSDLMLGDLVEAEFARCGVEVRLTSPDLSLVADRVGADIASKVRAGVRLMGEEPRIVVVHRDANGAGREARLAEIETAVQAVAPSALQLGLVPERMTEAWLLSSEERIRVVAGSPRGRVKLNLPTAAQAQTLADPKARLEDLLLEASETTGRRRRMVARRFTQQRRQLMSRLTPEDLAPFSAWQETQASISALADELI